jgi:CheY-like chemotaxis protein
MEHMDILVVDDEQLVRWFLHRALTKWGHKVVAVSSAREALQALQKDNFDVVFTDLRMPEENGTTLLQKLGDLPKGAPKVVVCSAYITEEMAEGFRRQGMGVLKKPFRMRELQEVLSRCLDNPASL